LKSSGRSVLVGGTAAWLTRAVVIHGCFHEVIKFIPGCTAAVHVTTGCTASCAARTRGAVCSSEGQACPRERMFRRWPEAGRALAV
jgi:hypothetical protein